MTVIKLSCARHCSQSLTTLLFLKLFMYLFSAVLGLGCCEGSSLVVGSRGYSLGAVHRLVIAAASLVGEHGL